MSARSLGQEDSLEKEMVPHSSILAWRVPWTEVDRVLNKGTLEVRQRGRIPVGSPFCVNVITKAAKHKSKKQFQHGLRTGFSLQSEFLICGI